MGTYDLRPSKQNNNDLELFHDGEFLASWGIPYDKVPSNLHGFITNMCQQAHENGKLESKKEIRTVLGIIT